MRKFKILVCEDKITDQEDIQLYLDEVSQDLSEISYGIDVKMTNFQEVIPELSSNFDLLVLDFYDANTSDQKAGIRVLNHNKNSIKTIIYSSTTRTNKINISDLKKRYSYLLDELTKYDNGDNLKQWIKNHIYTNFIEDKFYSLYNENDQILVNSIITIGESNLNSIIHLIRKKFNYDHVILHRMTSGLSGAILFKLEVNGKYSILKISKEIEKLKQEHENAIKLYHEFPSRLINHIDPEYYYSSGNNALGILLKEVDNSQTFFDFICNDSTNKEIEIQKFLCNLFLDDQGLKNHYEKNKGVLRDWTSIFDKMNESKMILIEKSYNELSQIVIKYYKKIDIEDFNRLTVSHSYSKLNKNKLLDKKYNKGGILSHGDFHAKNILVQSNIHPILIDTGSINYQHWCLDLCRLVVNTYIFGFDINSIDYFELESIKSNMQIVEKLIRKEQIDTNGSNDNLIFSMNWIINNIDKIFDEQFELFEYQLGLMKEFLQLSFRFDTVPPNKRALALIAAHKCMISASESVICNEQNLNL